MIITPDKADIQKHLLWKQIDIHRRSFDQAAFQIIKRALDKQIQPVFEHILRSSNNQQAVNIPDNILRDEVVFKAFETLYIMVGVQFAKQSNREVSKVLDLMLTKDEADDLEPNWIQSFIRFAREEAGTKIQGITNNILSMVRGVLIEAGKEGLSIPNTAKRLRERWGLISRRRALLISRTEVITASNAGSLEGALSTGFEMQKVWLSTRDNNTRDDHTIADGQKVNAKSNFIVGGETAKFPGDVRLSGKQRIQCRCTLFFEVI